jgi:Deoxynucleoside kinase
MTPFEMPEKLRGKYWTFPRRLVAVEGVPGAGKSKFIDWLCARYSNLEHYEPPVPRFESIFRESGDGDRVEVDFNELERWWWAFGTHMLEHGVCGVSPTRSTKVFVIEGTLETSVFIYAQYHMYMGKMTPVQYRELTSWFYRARGGLTVSPKIIFYLQVNPVVAFNRLRARGAPQNAKMSLEFLRTADRRMAYLNLGYRWGGRWYCLNGSVDTALLAPEVEKLAPLMFDCNVPHGHPDAHVRGKPTAN